MNHQEVDLVSYPQGLPEPGRTIDDLPLLEWGWDSLPQHVKDAIFRKGLFDLGGVYGSKEVGDPVEYDHLCLAGTETETNMTIFNRGIALFFMKDESIIRFHRVLCLLGKLDTMSVARDD